MLTTFTSCKAIVYHKRQKLSKRKVSGFTRFHTNVGKTFAVIVSTVWKVQKNAIAELSFRQENFCDSSKIRKNCKTVFSLNFCRLQ